MDGGSPAWVAGLPSDSKNSITTLDTAVRVDYNGHNNYRRQTMEEFQHILPVTKVKRDLLDILKRMEEEEATIAVTRNGEAVGIMMSLARYDALMETIEILGDPKVLKSLEKSKEDFKAGRVFSHEEVWEE
jgi:antitoxin YefM